MTVLFYTHEADFAQPHETLEDAVSWFLDYDVQHISEVEHDDDMNVVFAWDRTIAGELAVELAATLRAARDYVPKNEEERDAIEWFTAKMNRELVK